MNHYTADGLSRMPTDGVDRDPLEDKIPIAIIDKTSII